MPNSVQKHQLKQLAEKFCRNFSLPGSAEASFLSSARFQGYSSELIEKVAIECWPSGYAAQKQRGVWQLQAH